mgnify:CR=1 FL=1
MSFSRADLNRLSAIMAEAAESEIMPRFRSLEENGGIREKSGALDLVTDADEQGEWKIRDLCAKAFPKGVDPKKRYNGKGVLKAVENVNTEIAEALSEAEPASRWRMEVAERPDGAELEAARVPAGTDVTTMYPWKLWPMASDPTGSTAAPMGFFQPSSNANEPP